MIYLLWGEDSIRVIKKIQELKAAFIAKSGNAFSLTDIDCRDEVPDNFFEKLGGASLFNDKRLVIVRGAIEQNPTLLDFFQKEFPRMKTSPDVFVFWEQVLSDKQQELFTQYAQKIQEFRVIEKDSSQSDDKSVFGFVDQIFNKRFAGSLITLRKAKMAMIEEVEIVRVMLWKLKNIFLVKHQEIKAMHPYVAKKTTADAALFSDTQLLDTFWAGIFVDSNLKRDNKNATEHVERFLLGIKENIGG